MKNIAEKLDDKLENAIYLLGYGINLIKSEKEFNTVLNTYFTKWKNKLIALDKKHDWFNKIKAYSDTFPATVSKGDKKHTHACRKALMVYIRRGFIRSSITFCLLFIVQSFWTPPALGVESGDLASMESSIKLIIVDT